MIGRIQRWFRVRRNKTEVALSFIETDGHTEIVLALAAISAYLKQQLPDVKVRLLPIHATSPEPEQSPKGFARRVARSGARIVGISCLSLDWKALDPYLQALKRQVPNVKVVIGGYQAMLSPGQTMAHPAVDFVCLADGEQPMVDLVRRFRRESSGPIEGMWERRTDGVIDKREPVLSEDLSAMPFPDYTLFEEVGALKGLGMANDGRFHLPVMTGRGCPYKCTYCCNTPLLAQWRGKTRYIRKYDPHALIEELQRLRDRYRVEYFVFWDELFLSDVRFVKEFLTLYKRDIRLPFSINSRVEKMDEGFCALAAEAGCDMIWFGIESGSEHYRHKRLNRTMTNEQVVRAADNCRHFGIKRLTFNIVGMPFETREDMLETLALNRRIQPDYFFFFNYLPLPGTDLCRLAEEHGLVKGQTSSDFQEGSRTGRFVANLLPHEGAPNAEEFQAVCEQMLAFQRQTEAGRHFNVGNDVP